MRKQSFHFNYLSLLTFLLLLSFVLGCSFAGAERDDRNSRNKRGSKTEEKEEKGLVGTWKNDRSTVSFDAKGMMRTNGQNYRYKATDDVITVTGNDGTIEMPYRLEDDTLTITVKNQKSVFQRVKKSTKSDGNVSEELVGKWCYMSNVNTNDGGRMSNRCITLNGDGTYEYYSETTSSGDNGSTASQESDSGTWSATEDTITANSNAEGTKTYSLEKRNHPKTGDPMIVIDGDAYVTYNQRAPW